MSNVSCALYMLTACTAITTVDSHTEAALDGLFLYSISQFLKIEPLHLCTIHEGSVKYSLFCDHAYVNTRQFVKDYRIMLITDTALWNIVFDTVQYFKLIDKIYLAYISMYIT